MTRCSGPYKMMGTVKLCSLGHITNVIFAVGGQYGQNRQGSNSLQPI